MATINHPGVVDVYDYGVTRCPARGRPAYLVMKFVDGEPLDRLLRRLGRIAPEPAMELIAQAASALQAVHDQGIVHRDVKPGNLLVRADGTLVLTDFGIARSDMASRLTDAGMVLGTAAYCAPEQAEGAPVTPAVDIYALGVVAYECLAGQRPFDGDTPVTIALKHIREAPPAAARRRPARRARAGGAGPVEGSGPALPERGGDERGRAQIAAARRRLRPRRRWPGDRPAPWSAPRRGLAHVATPETGAHAARRVARRVAPQPTVRTAGVLTRPRPPDGGRPQAVLSPQATARGPGHRMGRDRGRAAGRRRQGAPQGGALVARGRVARGWCSAGVGAVALTADREPADQRPRGPHARPTPAALRATDGRRHPGRRRHQGAPRRRHADPDEDARDVQDARTPTPHADPDPGADADAPR